MCLDELNEVHPVDDFPEDDVLAVQPGGHDGRDEELEAFTRLYFQFSEGCGMWDVCKVSEE